MQKKVYLIFLMACIAAGTLSAQFIPQGFNYQGIIRDANGAPLANQTATLLFAIRTNAPNGPVAYSEKQVVSTNEYGLVNLIVGQGGTPIQGSFSGINWGSSAKYLSVSLETSPNVFDDLGVAQLMSVPYALYALSTANGGNDDWGNQVIQSSQEFTGNGTAGAPLRLAPQNAANGQVLKWNGAAWTPQNDNAGGGTVTEINTGAGLSGGPITGAGTISLSNTGVMPGTYGSAGQIPVITVDEKGRITTVTTINVQGGGGSITLVAGTGIDVQQNGTEYTVSNTGDTNPSDDLTNISQAGGDLNGSFANLQINPGAVGASELANEAVNSAKIAPNAVNSDKIAPDAVGAVEIATGAVGTGEIADGAVTGSKINNMGAQTGQVLKWNGSVWLPQTDETGGGGNVNLTAGAGISVTGATPNFTIANTGDLNASDDLTTASVSNGDVTGPFSNLQLKQDVVSSTELTDNAVETANITNGAVTGQKINAMGATNGQVLKFNGTTWTPAADQSGTANVIAGIAIDVIDNGNGNYVINNAGDIDPFNDITVNTPSGGDVTGFFNNLQINPSAVTSTELANNAVQTDKITNGAVTGTKINQMSANPGQVLKWNGSAWAPAQDQAGVGDNWGSQVATTNTTLAGNGATTPLSIAQQGAANGQVLKWDGITWTPANDNNDGPDKWGTQTAETDPSLSGNGTSADPLRIAPQGASNGQVLKWNGTNWIPADDNNDGPDNWGTQTAETDPSLSGNGTSADPLRIAPQGASNGQVLKFDGTNWLPADDNNDGPDNWGTQTAETDPSLSGNGTSADPLRIAPQGASNGQVLKWNGTNWIPADDNNSAADNWGTQTAATNTTLAGNGTTANPLRIAPQGASNGQVLKFDGTNWIPAADDNDGPDDWGTQTAATNTTLAGNGTTANPLRIAPQGASNGQVLKWNGTNWIPADDNNSAADNWGTQTAATNATLVGNGTTANPLRIAPQGASNGQVLKFDGTNWIPAADDNDGPDDWGTQTAATNTTLAGNGTTANPLRIAPQGASNGQVLKWNGTNWIPADDNNSAADNWGTQTAATNITLVGNGTAANPLRIAPQGASNGQVLKWNGINWIPADDNNSAPDNWGTQTAATNITLVGNGTAANPLRIAPQGAFSGQVLKWNGTNWSPANDNNDGPDNWGTQSAATNATLAGNGTSADPLRIAPQGASNGQVLKWNGTNWLPADDNNSAPDNWGTQSAETNTTLAGNGTSADPLRIAPQGASNGQVLKFNGTNWLPADDNNDGPDDWGTQSAATNTTLAGNGTSADPLRIAPQGASNGQVLKWNGTNWLPADDNNSAPDNWGAQTAATNTTLAGNGTSADPLRIAPQGASNGQVLKWNGTNWLPADDNNSAADNWGTQSAETNTTLAGNGTSADPLRIAPQGASNGQVLKWNGTNWLPADDNNSAPDNWGTQTAATNITLVGNGTAANPLRIAPQGAFSGQVLKWNGTNWSPANDNNDGPDNWGTQSAATNATLAGNGTSADPLRIAPQGASNGQVLKFDGTNWIPAADDNDGPDDWGTQTAATNTTLAGNGTSADPLRIAPQGASNGQVLKFDGTNWIPAADDNDGPDDWGTQSAATNTTLAGNGTSADPLRIAPQGASNGQVLKFDGTNWLPADDNNDGSDNWGTQTAATNATLAGNGTSADPLRIAPQGAANGQVLKWNGANWLPANDNDTPNNNYAAGFGIAISGAGPNFTIVNTGDNDNNASNELQTISLVGSALSLSNGGGSVNLPPANNYTAGAGISISGASPDFIITNIGDTDADTTNEVQNLTLTGAQLSISKGNTVDLSGLSGFWEPNGDDINNTNIGNVLVGTPSSTAKFQVEGATGAAAYFNATAGPALITDKGFVGLNKPDPTVQLHVKGQGEIIRAEGPKAAVTLSNSGGGFDGFFRISDTLVAVGTTTAALDVALLPNGKPSVIANANTGNVGIGAPNNGPASLRIKQTGGGMQLENASGIHFWELAVDDLVGNLQLFNDQLGPLPAGTFDPLGFYTPSDRRLKHDIRALESTLDKIMRLEPVRYRLNNFEKADPMLGFIAQDVYALFPELVGEIHTRTGEKYQSVNYTGFGVLAIKAIQEQQTTIETLKKENQSLQTTLLRLEQRLAKLETSDNR